MLLLDPLAYSIQPCHQQPYACPLDQKQASIGLDDRGNVTHHAARCRRTAMPLSNAPRSTTASWPDLMHPASHATSGVSSIDDVRCSSRGRRSLPLRAPAPDLILAAIAFELQQR
jgi:hypothetical protein